jgi:hypothetical protein
MDDETTTERFRDFDEAFAEVQAEPIRIRLYGRDWELPGSMPAALVIKVSRWSAEGRDLKTDLTGAELFDFAAAAIPRPVLDEWMGLGLDAEHQLPEIIRWVIGLYLGRDLPDGPGEVFAPPGANRATRRSSSKGGRSSKRTSSGSTRSASRKR